MYKKFFDVILILAIAFAGCSEAIVNDNGDDGVDIDFCDCLNSKDFGKTIPFINEWFSSSPAGYLLYDLRRWIKETKFCDIVDARIINMDRDTGMAEMAIMFEEDGMTKIFILEVSNSNHPSKSDFVKVAPSSSFGDCQITGQPDALWKVEGFYEYLDDLGNFCEDFDVNNIDTAIPIINKFLSNLSVDLTGEHKIDELRRWLRLQPCDLEVRLINYSAIKTNPPTGKMSFQGFPYLQSPLIDDEGAHPYYVSRQFVLEIAWTNPMTVRDIHQRRLYGDEIEYEFTEEPVDIPSKELWKFHYHNDIAFNGAIGYFFNDLIIANSKEDMEKYISDTDCYPAIDFEFDFEKQSILLVYGFSSMSIWQIKSVYLQKFSTGYVLNIDRDMLGSDPLEWWQAAFVTEKIPDGSKIEILVNYVPFKF